MTSNKPQWPANGPVLGRLLGSSTRVLARFITEVVLSHLAIGACGLVVLEGKLAFPSVGTAKAAAGDMPGSAAVVAVVRV